MPTQHRPGKEPKNNAFNAASTLERFYNSVSAGNHDKMQRLLEELEKHPPHGLWMHRALSLTLEGPADKRMKTLQVLFSSKHPPQPTERSDFIMLASRHFDYEAVYFLLDKGFRGRPKTMEHILQQMEYGRPVDVDRIKTSYIANAPTYSLVTACARAVVSNASETWLRTLNAALPQPLPGQDITRRVMENMVRLGPKMHTVSTESLNRARDLWWVDHNMAQLAYENIAHARNYKGSPLHGETTVEMYGQALSMIARSGLEEEPLPQASATSTPRKRL